ncbi:MAG: tRNA pseudouridine(38-40) synthase TruA [Rhabdochlamydiaceae bacterium]|nr:tRNA pseudouridine(38-40) synthase TruA [Rhabdochlamydiaceae bacterium]
MTYKYKALISYDGTRYGGWQVQPNAVTIQEQIQKALSTVLRTPTDLTGSGRTDAGVHALGQCAHFTHPNPIDLSRSVASLNGLLPADIRIHSLTPVAEEFHARYSATGKVYHYHLHLDPILNPFSKLYRYHVPHRVNLELMKEAAKGFLGTHDFTSFTNQAAFGSAAHDPVRTLTRLDLVLEPGGVRLEFEGNGFLYKMVRNIVGTLLDIGSEKIPLERLPAIFAAKDRSQAGRAAPAHGLFLVHVHYAAK